MRVDQEFGVATVEIKVAQAARNALGGCTTSCGLARETPWRKVLGWFLGCQQHVHGVMSVDGASAVGVQVVGHFEVRRRELDGCFPNVVLIPSVVEREGSRGVVRKVATWELCRTTTHKELGIGKWGDSGKHSDRLGCDSGELVQNVAIYWFCRWRIFLQRDGHKTTSLQFIRRNHSLVYSLLLPSRTKTKKRRHTRGWRSRQENCISCFGAFKCKLCNLENCELLRLPSDGF